MTKICIYNSFSKKLFPFLIIKKSIFLYLTKLGNCLLLIILMNLLYLLCSLILFMTTYCLPDLDPWCFNFKETYLLYWSLKLWMDCLFHLVLYVFCQLMIVRVTYQKNFRVISRFTVLKLVHASLPSFVLGHIGSLYCVIYVIFLSVVT